MATKFTLDRTATMLPAVSGKRLGRCAICGKSIYDDERVVMVDGSGVMFHENCAVFREKSLSEFLDLFGMDYYTGTARELMDDE